MGKKRVNEVAPLLRPPLECCVERRNFSRKRADPLYKEKQGWAVQLWCPEVLLLFKYCDIVTIFKQTHVESQPQRQQRLSDSQTEILISDQPSGFKDCSED